MIGYPTGPRKCPDCDGHGCIARAELPAPPKPKRGVQELERKGWIPMQTRLTMCARCSGAGKIG